MASIPSMPTLASSPLSGGSFPSVAAGAQQRLRLKQTPIDTWSLKEQLGLASAVLRSGDQNWVSVSRQMKPFAEEGRPADWFSQKNCALQYNLLLEASDTPRRKRGDKLSGGVAESTETQGEAIVKRLTGERIKELYSDIEVETIELLRLQEECRLLQSSDDISEEKLAEIEAKIENEDKEDAEKKLAHEKWLAEREEKKMAIQAALKAHSSKIPLKGAAAAAAQQAAATRRTSTQSERSSFSDVDSPMPVMNTSQVNEELSQDDKTTPVKKADTSSTSPLLSSLLNSPSSLPTPTPVEVSKPSPVKSEEKPEAATKETEDKEDEKEEPMEAEQTVPDTVKVEEVEETETEKVEVAKDEEEVQNEVEVEEEKKEPLPIDEDAGIVDDDDGDEVIIKKEVDPEDSFDLRKPVRGQNTQRSTRAKKQSEVSEEDEDDSTRSTRRETRSKKISEKSDEANNEAEESPAPPPPLSRATRRSKKVELDDKDDEAANVENRRLSRLRDASDTSGRGRRGSGAMTTSRSSSPVASGDESEADPSSKTRTRRKSGRPPLSTTTTAPDTTDSAPASPSVSLASVEVTSEDGVKLCEWRKQALAVLQEMKSHKSTAKVFANDSQDYNEVVLKPMDLATIKKAVEAGSINTTTELHRDVANMFLNIVMCNSQDSEMYETAMGMYRDCSTLLEDLQMPVTPSKSPVTTPSGGRVASRKEAESGSEAGRALKTRDKKDSTSSNTPSDERRKRGATEEMGASSSKRRKR